MNNTQPTPATIDQQIFQKKLDEFNRRLDELQNEIGIVAVPMLQSTDFGIFPYIARIPKEQYDKFIEQQQQNLSNITQR